MVIKIITGLVVAIAIICTLTLFWIAEQYKLYEIDPANRCSLRNGKIISTLAGSTHDERRLMTKDEAGAFLIEAEKQKICFYEIKTITKQLFVLRYKLNLTGSSEMVKNF